MYNADGKDHKLKHYTKHILKKITVLLTAAVTILGVVSYSSLPVVHADSQQSKLESQLKDNKQKQDELDKKIKSTKNDIAKEKEHQEAIDQQIVATEEYIRTLTDLIADYNTQIDNLSTAIADKEEDIAATQKLIDDEKADIDSSIVIYERQLRSMYISGNDSVASVILGASDFFDMLMKLELIKRVANSNNDFIAHLLSIKENYEWNKATLEDKLAGLEADKATLETKKTDVEALKADWDNQLADLNALYKESKAEIKKLQEEKEAYEENKEEIEKANKKLEEEIQRIIREAARKEYMGDLPEGSFLWPVPGFYQITSPYGTRWGTTHRGIDISSSGIKGANITAANSGEVIFVANNCSHNYGKKKSCGCGGGFGNYCMIDHGGGYVTVYGHASRITVKEGQHVTTGDVIGTVGSTGYSTGYHLHFEVRVNGERKDPQKFNLIQK